MGWLLHLFLRAALSRARQGFLLKAFPNLLEKKISLSQMILSSVFYFLKKNKKLFLMEHLAGRGR